MNITEFGMGYLPDLKDYRDLMLASIEPVRAVLPPSVDLRNVPLPILNQSSLGSCTGHGVASLFRFVDVRQGGIDVDPSRLFIYYQARKYRGWEDRDSGAYIRDAIKTVVEFGAAPEEDWPYDVNKYAMHPAPLAYQRAVEHQAVHYLRVEVDLNAMKSCLAAGYPFTVGTTLYENFYQIGADGMLTMPSGKEIGGHCYLVVGYRDSDQRFICQNSWSDRFGDRGYFYAPYTYLASDQLSGDAWTIRSVEEGVVPLPDPLPEPIDPNAAPKIRKVKRGADKYKIVGNNFHPEAALWIDGLITDVGEEAGRFVLKTKLAPGDHSAMVVNPNNKASAPFPFKV